MSAEEGSCGSGFAAAISGSRVNFCGPDVSDVYIYVQGAEPQCALRQRVGSSGVGTGKLQTSVANVMEESGSQRKGGHHKRHSKYDTIEVYIA